MRKCRYQSTIFGKPSSNYCVVTGSVGLSKSTSSILAETDVDPIFANANKSPMKIASIAIRFFIFILLANMLYYSQRLQQALWWPVCIKGGIFSDFGHKKSHYSFG